MTFVVGDHVRPKDNHLTYFRMVRPFTKGTIVRKKLVTVESQDKDLRTYKVICVAERLELEEGLKEENRIYIF